MSVGRISAEESLFTYITGQSPSTFNQTSFTPVFDIDDLPYEITNETTAICGDNIQCLFDIGATGDVAIGMATLESFVTYNETVMLSQLSN